MAIKDLRLSSRNVLVFEVKYSMEIGACGAVGGRADDWLRTPRKRVPLLPLLTHSPYLSAFDSGLQARKPRLCLDATDPYCNAGLFTLLPFNLLNQLTFVRQDDLNVFHARVFGSLVPPPHLISPGVGTHYDDTRHPTLEKEEEEDDLGYYPDGKRRTLTDDQIAMFRHSEIYAILRERQVRKENREADGDGELADPTLTIETSSNGLTPLELEEEGEKTAPIYKDNFYDSLQADSRSSPANNKRKRNNGDTGDRSDRAYTHRRLARELDTATSQDCVLDYGDEPTEKELSTHAHPLESGYDNIESQRERKASVKGQRIWWPVIQAPS